jgi:predicted permease
VWYRAGDPRARVSTRRRRRGHSLTASPRERRIGAALMTLQIALAVMLVCAAVAFGKSLQRVLAAHPGFASDHVLVAQMLPNPVRYPDTASRARFVDRIVARLGALPGVVAAGTSQTTFLPNQSMQTNVYIEGQPLDAEHAVPANIRHVMPGYFPALRVPMVEGRPIDARDRAGAAMVAVVSAAFAKTQWPDRDALGRRVRRTGATAQWLTVVGVAADVMDVGLGVPPGPTLYVPYQQQNTVTARVTLLVRGTGEPRALVSDVQHAVWMEDPLQPVDAIAPLDEVLAGSTGDRQFQTLVLGAFAAVGLTLALVGVYGVSAAAVKARAREVGVRLALGATPRSIVADAVREAGWRVAVGVVAGVSVFLLTGRAVAQLLYATSPWDPVVLATAVLPLGMTAVAITYRQARRLAATPPVLALRGSA